MPTKKGSSQREANLEREIAEAKKKIAELKIQQKEAVEAARRVAEVEMQKRAEEVHKADEARRVAEATASNHAQELEMLREQIASTESNVEPSSENQSRSEDVTSVMEQKMQELEHRYQQQLHQEREESHKMLTEIMDRLSRVSESRSQSHTTHDETGREPRVNAHEWKKMILNSPANLTLQSFKNWQQIWDTNLVTHRLEAEPRQIRIGVLKCAIHDDWLTLWNTGNLDVTTRDDTKHILQKMYDYLRSKRHILLDREEFIRRNQQEGESIDTYLSALKKIDECCAFDEPKICGQCNNEAKVLFQCEECGADVADTVREERLRDRFICGLWNSKVRKEVLKLPYKSLTLGKVLEVCRAEECSEYNENKLKEPATQNTLHIVQKGNTEKKKCSFCGKNWHAKRADCPANGMQCKKCNKKGHFKKMCKSKTSAEKTEPKAEQKAESKQPNLAFLKICPIARKDEDSREFTVKVTTNKKVSKLTFMSDSGADFDAIGVTHLEQLGLKKKDLEPDKEEASSANGLVQATGQFYATIEYQGYTINTVVHVFPRLKIPILCYKTCTSLHTIPTEWAQVAKLFKLTMTQQSYVGEKQEIISQEKLSRDKELIVKEYNDVFQYEQLGRLKGKPMHIDIIPGANPCKKLRPYSVPLHWREKLKRQIDKMEDMGIIEKVPVGESYQWCHGMVVTPKKHSDELRLTVDLKGLNKYVVRPAYPTNKPSDAVAQIPPGCKYFTTLDARHGYWQICLDTDSKPLTTFMTLWGAYRYKRNPMGLISAGDEHNRRCDEALQGLDNIQKVVEDIIIYDSDYSTHVERVKQVIQRCLEHGINLNVKKFVFAQAEVEYCGYRVSSKGHTVSEDLVRALKEFPEPKGKTDVRAFCGLVQQFSKYSPDIAAEIKMMSHLTSPKVPYIWEGPQQEAFARLKRMLSSPAILAQYDPARSIRLETDAAQSKGLGYALWQQQKDRSWRLLQCGSRIVSDAESRYSATEIELKAVAFAVEKCRLYLLGRSCELIVDHRPLIPIINDKTYDDMDNRRIQRLMAKLTDYQLKAVWREGKNHKMADALSRYPVDQPTEEELGFISEMEETKRLLLTACWQDDDDDSQKMIEDKLLKSIRSLAQADHQYKRLKEVIIEGFPDQKQKLDNDLKEFWSVRSELTVEDGLVLNGQRILIPKALRKDVLSKLHASHLGQTRTLARARQCVFWPNITNDIRNKIQACEKCATRLASQAKEPMIQETKPEWPFQMAGADLCSYGGQEYLVYVDKLSGYCRLWKLGTTTTTPHIISGLQYWFVEMGIPVKLTTDGGPQFSSAEFQRFCQDWNVNHDISSPHHPEGNGHAEAAVKVVKNLLAKCTENGTLNKTALLRGLLEYYNTPRECGLSPAQMVFGRSIRSIVPVPTAQYKKEWNEIRRAYDKKADRIRELAQEKYNERAHSLSELQEGDVVRIQNHVTKRWDKIGQIVRAVPNRRNYWIRQESGRILRRNRKYLRPHFGTSEESEQQTKSSESGQQLRRSSRQRVKPQWYGQDQ